LLPTTPPIQKLLGILAFTTIAAAQAPVILISIDTLRADHVGIYGYKAVPTPNLDAFANGGTIFPNVDCQTPLTLPSHTSLFTSTYPFENGIQENAEQIPPNAVTLASVLKSRGYKTAAFVSSVFLEQEMGLDKGFDTYDSPFHFAAFSPVSGEMFLGGPPNLSIARERRDGALTVRAAARWLAANKGQPVFVFIHLFDLHTPYSIPEHKGISRYDAQLVLEDEIVGRLKNLLVQSGWWDKSLTILLSDHGEGLGDHGEQSHGYFIYESTLHVPVIFHWPANRTAQYQLGGLIDVAPAILDFLHLPIPAGFQGKTVPHPIYSESLHTHDSFGWSPLRSVRVGNDKYIEAPKPELYDLSKDPAEQHNLVLTNPERARTLRAELGKILALQTERPASPGSTSPQTEKLLSSLGYLGRGPEAKRSGADPKDRLAEFHLYEKAIEKMGDRDLTAAITLLKQVLAQDPANTLARRDLASCYLDLHNYTQARTNFQLVVKAAPRDYPSQFGLGLAAKHLKMIEEARTHLEAACKLAPQASQCEVELRDLSKP
jgi:arylsulfatase A-like enzyme